ncbi:MAG: helix-turn-helix domain-containing protein [bacterium]|nr:helix-turn-helix domain-containing protein [bacterium]MDZ4343040.1 helix-turn-helix domain-containing protein [Candidatus Binatia bacterium]
MVNINKQHYSTTEVAEILGISRTAVFKKIKAGILPAEKAGRNYVITKQDLQKLTGGKISEAQKREVETAVHQAIKEYREVFEKLAQE